MRCNLHVVQLYKFIGIELILAKIEMFDLWKTRMTTNLKKEGSHGYMWFFQFNCTHRGLLVGMNT
jgi:hypothetical protein